MRFRFHPAVLGAVLVVAASVACAATVQPDTAPPAATVQAGSLAAQALIWVETTFGAAIAAALTALIVRWMRNAGFIGAELLSGTLDRIILNGLHAGAQQAAGALKGEGTIEIKNQVVGAAVRYAQDHGADTLKSLGVDPTSPKAVEAIKARIAKMVADPAVATPPVMGGPDPYNTQDPNNRPRV